jgi:hypothetical protein
MKKTRISHQASTGSKQISFLPEPDFNPKVPSNNTLAFRALRMMLRGKKISHPDFEGKTASWRLAAQIHILKKMGWPIQTVGVCHLVAKNPKARHISRYFLENKCIMKARKHLGGDLW